jgi:hypothetical protein
VPVDELSKTLSQKLSPDSHETTTAPVPACLGVAGHYLLIAIMASTSATNASMLSYTIRFTTYIIWWFFIFQAFDELYSVRKYPELNHAPYTPKIKIAAQCAAAAVS